MKFPKTIKNRKTKASAKIYGKSKAYPFYRVAWRVDGKRMMKNFRTYSDAKAHAERMVADAGTGSRAHALTAGQANDALAAFERLRRLYTDTGLKISLFAAVSEFAEAKAKLGGRPLGEVVDGFLSTVANIKRKDVSEAVEDFIAAEEPKTKASDGKRPELSPKYHYNRAIMLRRFAASFPSTAVCDLTKGHLDTFVTGLASAKGKSRNKKQRPASAKVRNHHRGAIRQFLAWCVRRDFLAANHRLGEADGLRPEHANTAEVSAYTPAELLKLLTAAEGTMQAMVAIGALAGLRTAEILRLDWEDVWRVPGHIEISKGKAKTRQRRLVSICPALAAWLEPFRNCTGKVCEIHEITFQQHLADLCEGAEVPRKHNGLRHSFCTYHFALHSNENLTAAEAGNSPAMIHAHYRGLATKKEAEAWFAVSPTRPANVVAMQAAGSTFAD